MAWIKFDKDLIDDPRVLRAAEELCDRYTVSVERIRGPGFSSGSDLDSKEQLSLMRNAVTGALVTLWVYADTHIRAGDVLPIGVTAIDRMVGVDGFCDLLGEDWVRPSEDGESVVLPGYCEKNGLLSRERRKQANAERQRRFRQRSNASSNGVSNGAVTPLDQDLDQDKNKGTAAVAALVDKQKKPNGAWWRTESGIKAKGEELGIPTRPGESWDEYKQRLFEKLNAKASANA